MVHAVRANSRNSSFWRTNCSRKLLGSDSRRVLVSGVIDGSAILELGAGTLSGNVSPEQIKVGDALPCVVCWKYGVKSLNILSLLLLACGSSSKTSIDSRVSQALKINSAIAIAVTTSSSVAIRRNLVFQNCFDRLHIRWHLWIWEFDKNFCRCRVTVSHLPKMMSGRSGERFSWHESSEPRSINRIIGSLMPWMSVVLLWMD